MRFRHARLYQDALDALARAETADPAAPTDQLVTVLCPRCSAGYFASYCGEPSTGQAARDAARRTLDDECPDHPHVFTLRL